MLLVLPVAAQVSSYGDKAEGDQHGDELPTVLQKVQIAQHLNQQLPLDADFVDDHGQAGEAGRLLRQASR